MIPPRVGESRVRNTRRSPLRRHPPLVANHRSLAELRARCEAYGIDGAGGSKKALADQLRRFKDEHRAAAAQRRFEQKLTETPSAPRAM